MNNTEIINSIAGLSKEQLLALWESSKTENTINNYRDWMTYLENLPDKTGFNVVVVSSLLRVVDNMARKYNSYEELNTHFDEIRKLIKEMCLYFPEFKHYFKVNSKKEMLNYDLSIYKFD